MEPKDGSAYVGLCCACKTKKYSQRVIGLMDTYRGVLGRVQFRVLDFQVSSYFLPVFRVPDHERPFFVRLILYSRLNIYSYATAGAGIDDYTR